MPWIDGEFRPLFSAHAEVFPYRPNHAGNGYALLRTRGGISMPIPSAICLLVSSPHTRRYFSERPRLFL